MALVQMLTRSLISMKKKEQQQKKRTNKPRTATAEVWRLIASLTRPNLESVGRLFFLNFLSFFFFRFNSPVALISSNVQKFILFFTNFYVFFVFFPHDSSRHLGVLVFHELLVFHGYETTFFSI